MKYFDIHSHLNISPLSEEKEGIIKTLLEKEVGTITVGVDLASSQRAVDIAIPNKNLFACVGFHPTEVTEQDFDLEKFKELSMNDKVVAIGECGLDYFRIESDDLKTKEKQKEVFMSQIELSIKRNLPLILHIRPKNGTMDAYEDALSIIENYPDAKGDVHFFVGSIEIAKRFLALGFYLSFTGVVTFARDYDEVIKMIPINKILTETDAPFVAPVPYRGQTSEPWMVEEVCKKIAEIKSLDIEETCLQILENKKNLFGI